jgi:hypothetical protein
MNTTLFDDHGIGLYWNHAGRAGDFTRPDVEAPAVKIALDYVVLQITLGQGAGTMGASVIGDEELAINIEYCKHEPLGFDPQRAAAPDVRSTAELHSLGSS